MLDYLCDVVAINNWLERDTVLCRVTIGVALAGGETRTVSDASSLDADGRPRLRRMRTQTDSSFVNLGTTIDSSQRIDPFMNLGSSEHQGEAPATQAEAEAPATEAGAPATTEAWGV